MSLMSLVIMVSCAIILGQQSEDRLETKLAIHWRVTRYLKLFSSAKAKPKKAKAAKNVLSSAKVNATKKATAEEVDDVWAKYLTMTRKSFREIVWLACTSFHDKVCFSCCFYFVR